MAAVVPGLSAPARASRFWVGPRPRPGRSRLRERGRTLVRPGGPLEEGATPRRPPLPLPSGTTRHAAAYHPCQPSPPGNVAAFSATPSGVPVAPRHTAAGGGGGSGAGAHPGARRKRQVPLPQRPWRSRWGRGLGKGVAGALRPGWSSSIRRAGGGAPLGSASRASCLLPSTAPARSSGPGGSPPALPHTAGGDRAPLTCPPSPAREARGDPCLAAARG